MNKQCAGCSLIFWLPVLCLALGPTASAVDDEAPALETPALESPAAPPSNAASLIPANTPPTLKALGGAVRPGGRLVLAAYATDADSSLVQVLAALHLRPGQPAPAWLEQTRWASPLAPFPLLEIAVSPPADAAPETYVIEVSATDDGGLSALGEMLLEVLPPEAPAAPPPAPSPAGAQGASSSSAAAVGGASSGTAGAAAAKAASSSSSESPSLSLSVSPASVAEGSIRDIVVTGTLMGVSMVPGVDVTGVLQVSGTATDGTDYSLGGTKTLVIPAGSATLTGTRTLRLSALGDDLKREGDETVRLRVTQVTRGTEVLALSSVARTSVTITDVHAKPPKVSGVAAQTASDSSLKVTWKAAEASPPPTKYVVQHRRDDRPDKQWTRTAEVSGGVLEALATGLHSGRRYDVRVWARNRLGKGDRSDEATANTAPKVTLEAADGGVASIREGNASVGVALTGWAKAQGGGTLTGQWLRVTGSGSSEAETAWGSSFTMASRRDYEKTARSDAPETRKYRLRVTHDLSGERATVDRDATVTWLPEVLLSASPSSVPEDGGARTVTVEAKLTGRTVSAASKSVRVNVKGDTATEGTDFAAVSDFTISIPGGDRSATGTFELSPTADSVSEGGETVKLKGSATEGDQELKARNAEVTIEDEQVTLTVSPTPANGSVTGTGIACGTGTAGDCSESVTKSTPLTLTASPASGWVFRKWSGACSEDEDASCALTVSGATTVGASFRRPRVKVEVSPAAGGSVTGTGISCGAGTTNDCSERVSTGSIALTAAPASGYAVSSWSGGGCSGKGTTCTADVTEDVTVTVTFAEGSVPVAPSGLSAAPGDGSVALSWTDPGDASITGYEIRRKAGSGAYGSWSDISGSGANTTSHSVTSLTNGTAYTFELRAENASGAGAGAEVSATPKAIPGLVTGVMATATGAATASLSWTAPASGGAVDSYTVSGSGTIAVSGTSATITGLVQDTDYKWTVQAVNGSGSGEAAESNTISIPHPPGPVTGLAASANSGSSATLSWTAPAIAATQGEAASYTVSRGGAIIVSVTETSATLTGLTAGSTYDWTVKAVNVSGSSSAASISLAMPTPVTLTVARSPEAGGSVTGAKSGSSDKIIDCGGDCEETVYSGDEVKLTATAASGHRFTGWTGCDSASGAVCTQTVGSAETVTANFVQRFALTVSKSLSAGGSVSGSTVSDAGAVLTSGVIDCGADCTETVDSGTKVKLTAAESSGHRFDKWSKNCKPDPTDDKTCTVPVDSAKTVTAHFVRQHTLKVGKSPVTGGTVTGVKAGSAAEIINCGTGCSVTVDSGTEVKLTAAESSGHRFDKWSKNCKPDPTDDKTCTVPVDSAKTVTAHFVRQYTLKVGKSPVAGGSVAGSIVSDAGTVLTSGVIDCGGDCAETVDSGTKVKLTATASSGHRFTGWTGCDSASGAVCTQTVGGAETVTANFVQRFALTVSKSPSAGGSVSGSIVSDAGAVLTSGVIDCGGDCAETVDSGTKVRLTAAHVSGYRFDGWTDCDSADGNVCTQTVGGDETVTANFQKVWTLTAEKSPSKGGSVSGSTVSEAGAVLKSGVISCGTDCDETVDEGDRVRLTAAHVSGYRFDGWTDCDSADGNVCTQTVGGDETVTANFQKVWTLTAEKSPLKGGSVSGSTVSEAGAVLKSGVISCGTDCDETVDEGDRVRLTAAHVSGYRFDGWTDCDSADGNVCTQTVGGDETVTANFQKVWTLTAEKSPSKGGSVSGSTVSEAGAVLKSGVISCGTDCDETVDEGDRVRLTAAHVSGYRFDGWTDCDSADGNVCTQTVGGDETVTANFQKVWTLTAEKSPLKGGSVSGSTVSEAGAVLKSGVISCGTDCDETVDEGDRVRLTAAHVSGYRFDGWTDCDSADGNVCTQTVGGDETVTANFQKVWTLTAEKSPLKGGSVSGSTVSEAGAVLKSGVISCGTDCDETVDEGDRVRLTAAHVSGYRFDGWTDCDSADGNVCTQTVGGDETVTANFQKVWTLTAEKSPLKGGSVSGSTVSEAGAVLKSGVISCGTDCDETVDEGDRVRLTAAHVSGYRFDGWTDCDSADGNVCTQTVGGDETVTANFQKVWTLAISVSPEAGGKVTGEGINCGAGISGSKACSKIFDNGKEVKLTATPTAALLSGPSYRFDSWSSNCEKDSTDKKKCIVTVDSAKTVTANFTEVLRVDAGGPYQAAKVPGRRFYSVTVRATASGGASPYSYAWEDKSANSRSATYLFPSPNGARLYGKKVTVTDADGNTATDTATITVTPSLGGFSDEFAYTVPLGGALSLVWGGGGSAAATSEDAGIAGVSVNGAEIIVSGVSAGRTEISVRAGQEVFRVPVRVGGG